MSNDSNRLANCIVGSITPENLEVLERSIAISNAKRVWLVYCITTLNNNAKTLIGITDSRESADMFMQKYDATFGSTIHGDILTCSVALVHNPETIKYIA